MDNFEKLYSAKDNQEYYQALRAIEHKKVPENKPIDKRSNAELSASFEFIRFCEAKGLAPSKRQASKLRNEFFQWHKENYKQENIDTTQ